MKRTLRPLRRVGAALLALAVSVSLALPAAASEALGLVMPGEKKIDVLGLDDDSDSSSSKKSSNAKKASEVAKEIEEVGKDAPWYIQALDMLFGFNGVEGQTVVSNGK